MLYILAGPGGGGGGGGGGHRGRRRRRKRRGRRGRRKRKKKKRRRRYDIKTYSVKVGSPVLPIGMNQMVAYNSGITTVVISGGSITQSINHSIVKRDGSLS